MEKDKRIEKNKFLLSCILGALLSIYPLSVLFVIFPTNISFAVIAVMILICTKIILKKLDEVLIELRDKSLK